MARKPQSNEAGEAAKEGPPPSPSPLTVREATIEDLRKILEAFASEEGIPVIVPVHSNLEDPGPPPTPEEVRQVEEFFGVSLEEDR